MESNIETICSICTNSFSQEGKQEKSKEKCSREDCEALCVKNSDLCQIHNRVRYPIMCLACNKSCCRLCYTTYFLTEEDDITRCVHCKKTFDIEFLLGEDPNYKQRFPKSFIWGELKEHREKVLLDKIMAKMPSYQRAASAIRKIEEINLQSREIDNQILLLKTKQRELDIKVQDQRFIINNTEAKGSKPVSYVTRGKCPSETCNGFIEDKWECGMCHLKICSHCMLIKLDEPFKHVCNEDDVKSTELIRESTKPCPSCRTRIYRIEGCAQMFCTNCHVLFCWNSGQELKKTQYVHNPHYTEFLLKNNLVDNGNGCDRRLTQNSFNGLQVSRDLIKKYSNLYRKANHILDAVRIYVDPIEEKIRDMSIKYINSTITKSDLATFVQKYHKASKKNELANMRRTTYGNMILEILTKLVIDAKGKNADQCKPITTEIERMLAELEELTEDSMINIGKMFNSGTPEMTTNFHEY